MPLFFWDCDVVEPVDAIQADQKQTCLEISPDGKFVAVGTDYGNVMIAVIPDSNCGLSRDENNQQYYGSFELCLLDQVVT